MSTGSSTSSLAGSTTNLALPTTTNNNNSTSLRTNQKPPRPITVEANFDVTNNLINSMNLGGVKPRLKIVFNNNTSGAGRTQVICASLEHKTKVLTTLVEKQISHFTFAEAGSKPKIFVLLGHFYMEPDALLTKLNSNDINATKVTHIKNRRNPESKENPIFFIHFKPDDKITIQELQHQHRTIDNLIVKWELPKSKKKHHVQCHRCMMWGHGATNCGRPRKCVKCCENHEPGKCLRTSKDQQGTPKCSNCLGEHPANFTGCQHYIDYMTRIQQQSQRSQRMNPRRNATAAKQSAELNSAPPTQLTTAQRRLYDAQHAPDIPSTSFADIVSGSRQVSAENENSQSQSCQPEFQSTFSAFNQIPGIAHTMQRLRTLIANLNSTLDENARAHFLLDYLGQNV